MLLIACQSDKKNEIDASLLHEWNMAYEKGIINDFFSPPVAGRMYTYPNVAAYAVLANSKDNFTNELKAFPAIPADIENKELVSLYTFYYVAKKTIYSFNYLDEYKSEFDKKLNKYNYSLSDKKKAEDLAKKLASSILQWSAQDGYKESRSDTKFVLNKMPGHWKPTSPDYADALEPNWEKIRTSFIDSAAQFTRSYKPYDYNINNQTSDFYKELLEVKVQVDKTNAGELATSKYWDCNPLAPQHNSHATYAEKKLTPGGHWMSITRNVSIQNKDILLQAAKAYAMVSLSIHDGFVSCWHSKYYYDYIRPITAIQENWDSEWNTLILTPNFPEYPSGHSVISGVASTILAHLYGDNTSFTDNAEEPFGMKPRSFTSFSSACDQAAMSRFYAGIHFRKAIEDGTAMGREIGNYILTKINTNE